MQSTQATTFNPSADELDRLVAELVDLQPQLAEYGAEKVYVADEYGAISGLDQPPSRK